MKLSHYIELRAKALVTNLNRAWNEDEAMELRTTLNDLHEVNLASKRAQEAVVVAEVKPEPKAEPVKAIIEPKPKKTKRFFGRVAKGERKAIIDLILDEFVNKASAGEKEMHFKASDFGVTLRCFQKSIFDNINTCEQKKKRFPDLVIKRRNVPDGVLVTLHRK